MKPFGAGLVVGRFQMPHDMHMKIIDSTIALCDKTLVMIGSSQVHGTERNPFRYEFREMMLRQIYQTSDVMIKPLPDMTDENDINTDWGKWVLKYATRYLGHKPDLMAYGNDENRIGWFDPNDIENMATIVIPRLNGTISATEMRQYIIDNDFWHWSNHTAFKLRPMFGLIRQELLHELKVNK